MRSKLFFLLKVPFYYFLGIVGIVFVSIAPHAFRERGIYNGIGYLEEFFKFAFSLPKKETWFYMYKGYEVDVIEMLLDPYYYSLQILFGALGAGLGLALILTYFTVLMPKWLMSPIKKSLGFLETVPDLMVAFLLQLFLVFFYKAFGVELMLFTALGEERVFLAPIITLSIIPMLSFYRILLLLTEEELLKTHVDFARSKGLGKTKILRSYIAKNISPSVFYHGKIIVWGMLSSLFIIETVFNMRGITYYIVADFRPITIAAALIMIYTPFFFLYQIIYTWLRTEDIEDHSKYKKDRSPFLEWKIWGYLATLWRLLIQHMKNPKFAIGFLALFSMITYSILYTIFAKTPVDQVIWLRDENGKLISAPPHKPSELMILGSDYYGYSILDQLIVGAKYTLIFALIVALLRVILGFYLSVYYHFYLNEYRKNWMTRIVDSIHFLPLSIIAYLLLRPVLWQDPFSDIHYSMMEKLLFEAFILTILVIPLTTVLIGNEMRELSKNEFILNAKLMGGSNRHILWTHLFPHLAPRLFILFGQQFIQVLFILVHLGLFHLFLGGTIVSRGDVPDPPKTSTFEWSGLISSTKNALMTGNYAIVLAPLAAFMISIIAMQLIVQGVKEIQQKKVGLTVFKRKPKKEKAVKEKAVQPRPADFVITPSKAVDHH
ncbi:ABC transporter permease subunit [Bacillus sp. SCS-153A]|uniref:ABC transporter permease subunit n=1 Tax=Rossellomorea sedimentorum TaxID=3115294 RepID=UPI0039059AA0